MRKDEVRTAAVDIEAHAGWIEQRTRHRRTLDVPARASVAVRFERPTRFARLGKLPQGKVERVFFLLVHLDARAGLEIGDVPVCQASVIPKRRNSIVHSVARDVSVSALGELPYHLLDLADIFGCIRLGIVF